MTMPVMNLKALSPGDHEGTIVGCASVQTDFGSGPEPAIEVVIQPKNPADGVYNPLTVSYSNVPVSPLSGFGKLLIAIKKAPDFSKVKTFEEKSIVPTPVRFSAVVGKNNFSQIVKDSITAL